MSSDFVDETGNRSIALNGCVLSSGLAAERKTNKKDLYFKVELLDEEIIIKKGWFGGEEQLGCLALWSGFVEGTIRL